MKYTNKTGLSNAIRDSIITFRNDYDKVGWKSVTSLISPPRANLLSERHDDEITEDISDMIWSWIGSMGHLLMERSAGENVVAEQRFIETVDGKQISFKPDRLEKNVGEMPITWTLRDFKVTSVYVLKGALEGRIKIEWERQMNMYVYLLELAGFIVSSIKLEIIGRDWRQSEQIQSPHSYPPSQACVVDVEIWPKEKQESYIMERIKLYKESEELPDSKLPFCTEDERWASPDRYAVVKKGSAKSKETGFRASLPKASYLKSREAAEAFIEAKKIPKIVSKNPKPETIAKAVAKAEKEAAELEVEFRKGESKRCERYCNAKPFCNQYREFISPVF